MDLPATQAIDEEEIASTQKFATENNENDQNCLVGSLQIDNKSHIILSGITVIGRHTACKIIIDHETISKKHAEIEADSADGTIFIRDLNSTNKTKINDTKLKPNSSYQIKDGDKLCFGKVIGIFKLYHAIDDSFTSCTLQANLKNQSIIPGTPDSSVNESDVSAIAGTQADDTDKCFRRPQIPARTSTDKEQNNLKLPDFSFDDLPSPLSNNKNDYDANIYNVETQKVANKSDNTDENIYEMETQRPFNLNMNENDIENFETQKYDAISDFGMKKSADISIYSNETQKVSKSLTNDTVLNNCEASKNLTTGDISIYSVETQKVSCKKSFNQSIEDIETQRFNYKELEISKASLNNVSIYSANTQKILSEEECNKFNCNESNNLKESDMSISSALTQKVEPDKLNNEFIVDSKTQKFDSTEIKSNDSIYSAATQKRISETSIVETIENLETQRFNCENVDVVEKKSTNTSIQKNISNSVINEPIDDLETQPFNKNQSDEKTLNNDISSDITVQKCISESLVNNKPLCNNSSHNINNIDSKKFENKSIHDMETQPFNKNSDEEINETSKKDEFQQNLNQDSNFTANLSLRIDNTETMSYFEENFPSNENLQDLDTHVPEEFLSSNCQTIEHKNKNNEINSFTVQNQNDSESNTAKELNKIHDFKKQEINNIHLQQENCNNIDQEDEEDDDMFCSQNLIQNCPFAFLPEESQNDDQIIITSKSFKESDNADEEKNDNINNASTNVSINSFNKNIENSLKKNQLMTVDENSGIKEKNTFLGCKFQENKNSKLDSTNIINNSKNSDDKINYSDSETDEEGIFSSHISPESDKKTSAKTNMKNTNEKSMNSENDEGVFSRNTSQINVDQNDSGTDKESVFPNHLFIDDKKSNSSINKKNSENKNNESDSATDEEGIFSNHIIEKVQSHKLYTKTTMNDSHDENNKSNLEIITNSDNKNIQEMDEIKIKNTNLLPRQVANENKLLTKLKNNITIMNDFTPSKLVNTKSFIVDDSDSENECSSPAQIVNMPKSETNSNNKDTEFSSPTQNRNEKNLVNEVIESDDFMLAPTQKIIDAQLCVESLIPNDTIQKQLKHLDTKNNENASVENLDLEIAPTQPIDSELNVLNLHKRRLQEFEIASSRKLQKTSDSKCTDFNKIIEKNLDEMFEGPDEKSIDEDAVLLTQQLTSILETSQASDNSQVDLNSSIPSPTLSSRRNTLKLRNRKVKSIINSNRNKSAINLNDTVERNLNEMFNNSINSMENYESDNMMTQQLKNVFESREENQMIKKNASALKKSLNVSIDTEKKKYRLSLSINKNATSTSKNLDAEQKLIKVQSNVNLKKEETIFQESSLNDESQNTEEYFLNLKSKKKSNFIQDSQSDEELSSSSSKKVIYKRGTVGFSNNKKSGSNSSSKRETRATATMTTMTNRSGLTIIRNKRSMASDSDNTQNQPPKRTKTQDDRYKLQELSPTVVTKSTLVSQKKNTIEAPKSLTGKDKTSDSSLTLENSLVDEKNQSDSKSNTHSLKTRGKATVGRKNVKETLIVENKCLSKENVLVSDSDVENVNDHSKIQNSGSKNKQNLTNLSIKEDNKIQVLNNDIENNSKRKTRGKMKNQKKNVAAKEKKESNKSVIIPNSDSEQSEDTENVINQQNQSKHAKENNKNLDSQKSNMSNKTENVNDKQTTSSQVNNVKNSDSEKSEKSEQSKPFFNKENKSRRLKTIANSNFEKSVDKSNRQENLKTSEKSKNSDSCEKLDTSEELQKSEKSIIKSRSTRIKSVKNFDTEKSEITTNKLRRNTRQNKNRDQSSDSVFSESSDYDVKKNKSVTNKNFHLQIRQTRKRTATNTNIAEPSSSEESQEIADILNNSKNKEMNSNKPHKRRKAKESNLNKSGSTHDSDNSDIPNSSIFEKPVSRAKRARLNKSTKSESMLQSSIDDQNLKLKLPQKSCTSQTRKTPSPTELSLSSLTPSRARRSVSMSPMKGSKHKVLFTGEKSEVHRKIVAKLGGTETESPAKCSILVADKVRRTFKFLCSLAQGIPIVSVKWLNDSDKVHRFLDWENYILNDPIAETKFKFKLKKSLEKAQNQKLLEGYTIFLTPQIAQPPISELKEMITSSGGKPILRAPTKWPEKTIIIAKQEDLEYIKKLALKSPKSATIHSTEFILTGILRQEVNLQEFKLSA